MQDAVVRHRVQTLAAPNVLSQRYGAVSKANAERATTVVEAEAFAAASNSLFVWLVLVVYDRKFLAGTVFFSHTNQPAVLLHEPATIRTNQPNRLFGEGETPTRTVTG